MTHYWWMHWFWITLVFDGILTVLLPETPYLNSTTETPMYSVNATTIMNKPNNTVNPVLPQTTLPPTIVAFKGTKKLKLLLSSPKNTSARIYNGTKELKNKNVPVIKTNLTKPYEEAIMTTISFQNETENVTYVGEELNLNQSFVQNSERIAMEGKVLGADSSTSNLSAAGITGITLGCVMVVGMISGVSLFFYRYHRFNRPQVLNDRCSNPDSSGYIDDASIRDNSEEMYSLDNDSFLNSLEAMTIQNYWTDTVKHTKL